MLEQTRRRIPLWVKIAYTLFVAVLVPKYWIDYGPTNFLYFCDVALLLTVVCVWRESALLASVSAVGILLPQALWQVDFIASLFGMPVTGMTAYMFDEALPLFTRFLSFFHFWLPLFLLWLLSRLGYDRRAFPIWTAMAVVLLIVCYFVSPPPPAPPDQPGLPVNINYVYGLGDAEAQSWMDPDLYFIGLLVLQPLVIFWPTHWLLKRVFPAAKRA